MMDEDQMVLVMTILLLLGRRPKPEEVQAAYQDAKFEYRDYIERNVPPQPRG
jgi:hypothetical protein